MILTLKKWLELQCDRVEAILAARKTPVRIVGGDVQRDRVSLCIQPAPHVKLCDIDAAILDGDLRFLGDGLHVGHVQGWAVLTFGRVEQ